MIFVTKMERKGCFGFDFLKIPIQVFKTSPANSFVLDG